MKKLQTVVAVVGFGFLVGAQAEPQWVWDAGKQTNNGAITIKAVSGGSYSGVQNPTGAAAKTNQSAVTQPPTVIVQGGQCGFSHSTFSRIVSGSGTLNPPADAVAMRVAVIGAGGSGRVAPSGSGNSGGGGGGGCAASKIVTAVPIQYTIGVGGAARPGGGKTNGYSGTNTTAAFGSYVLVGGGGGGGTTVAGPGGVASGGDYNFDGGNGFLDYRGAIGGGGGAGPNGAGGDGADGVVVPWTFTNSGWGSGGGAGGTSVNSGGFGTGLFGNINLPDPPADFPWGRNYSGVIGQHGGEMGGGGGGRVHDSLPGGAGGSGGMVVEWFYADASCGAAVP